MMRQPPVVVFARLLATLAVLIWVTTAVSQSERPPLTELSDVLGSAAGLEGYKRALLPGEIQLPRDHGPHPDYQSEWWYFTGNLETEDDAEFGFQLTFFRYATRAPGPTPANAWESPQIYMAHFAITDIAGDEHRVVQRFARPAGEVAGARSEPFAVWLDDWSAESLSEDFLPQRLRAHDAATDIALDLILRDGKPAVLQGDAGLSAKGPDAGNASWYYSKTRMPADGTLRFGAHEHAVRGLVWLDREWGTSALGDYATGWDWVGLQLQDGRDLMLYQLRDATGAALPESSGSLVDAQGVRRALTDSDFTMHPLDYWTSPATGTRWPTAWRIDVPNAGLELYAEAAVADQEQALAILYWEGSVNVLDGRGGERVGRGYLEMTGYEPDSP